MDELDPIATRRLDAAFADFRADALDRIVDPNPDGARRIAYRRTRNRITAVGTLAVAIVAGSLVGVLGTNGAQLPDPPVAGTPGPTAQTTPPSTSPSGSPSVTPSSPSPSPTTSGTATPTPTAPTSPKADRPDDPGQAPAPGPGEPTRPTDLVLTGPAEVTLTPSDGRYAGNFQITVRNQGQQPYDMNPLILVEPLEVRTWFNDDHFGGCFYTDQNSQTRTSECTGFGGMVPTGGSRTSSIRVTVDIAAAPGTRTVDGYRLTIRSNLGGTHLTDETPDNNTVTVRLRLTGG